MVVKTSPSIQQHLKYRLRGDLNDWSIVTDVLGYSYYIWKAPAGILIEKVMKDGKMQEGSGLTDYTTNLEAFSDYLEYMGGIVIDFNDDLARIKWENKKIDKKVKSISIPIETGKEIVSNDNDNDFEDDEEFDVYLAANFKLEKKNLAPSTNHDRLTVDLVKSSTGRKFRLEEYV